MRSLLSAAVVSALTFAAGAGAEPLTKVTINGSITPVYFNDGDSFRIQAGPFKGTQSRLSGYNTLESFGPVHQWGSWTEQEMYVIAKMATHEAQQGVWSCEGDGEKDGYGRLLLFCKDLALHLIERGLAHTYSVNEQPGDPDLLKVQREAMAARRGMWAHGIPRFIVTSLHSKSEGGDKDGVTSNRLISTTDAHTDKWVHNDDYAECQKVCSEVDMMTEGDAGQNAELLAALPEAAAALNTVAETDRTATLRAAYELLARGAPADAAQAAVLEGVRQLKGEGKLVVTGKQSDSCHVFVDFRRRFGGERAKCLH